MTRLVFALFLFGLAGTAQAGDPAQPMSKFLAVWADNARVTPQAVDRFYAGRVLYYGKPMTAGEVYRDKLNFIRRWPDRRYAVVPGSVTNTCTPDRDSCRVTGLLSWARSGQGRRGGSRGTNTVVLTLVRQNGTLKIVRESGTPLSQVD